MYLPLLAFAGLLLTLENGFKRLFLAGISGCCPEVGIELVFEKSFFRNVETGY